MEALLSKLSKEKKPCYLTGDFNMDLLELHKHTEIETFFDSLTSNKFMPLITNPTRISKTSKTLIDNIFNNQFTSATTSGNLTVGISDHLPQFALIPDTNYIPLKLKNTKRIRKYKQIDIDKFNQDLNSIDWTMQDTDDINQYGTNFLNVFTQVLDTHAPLTEIKLTKAKLKQITKPWIKDDIIQLIKIKDRLHAQYIKEKDHIKKIQILNDYKLKKNEITKTIRSSKRNYYNEYFTKHNKNVKKLWVGINQIINNNKIKENGPACIEIDDNGTAITITETKAIAEEFNKHYASVADKILSKRKYQGKHPFTKYLKNPNPKSFMMTPASNSEIIDIISNMDTSKSVGPNSIPNQLIHAIKHSISTPLANIFNCSFLSGNFPEFLKLTKIIPIHKKRLKAQYLKLQTNIIAFKH